MKCDICKKEKAMYLVEIGDTDKKYLYKNTYRCEECKERAIRSYKNVTITKL